MESDVFSRTVPPLPPRYRFRDLIWGDHALSDDDRVRVEYFTNEKSFKERLQLYFIKNQRSSLRIRIFNLAIKLLTCVLYVARVMTDDPRMNSCIDLSNCDANATKHVYMIPDIEFRENPVIKWQNIIWVERHNVLWIIQVSVAVISLAETSLCTEGINPLPPPPPAIDLSNCDANATKHVYMIPDIEFRENPVIKWQNIIWVERHNVLWIIQVSVAVISLAETSLVTYLGYKGNILQQILSVGFFLEICNTVPFIVTVCWPDWSGLFIPVFLNCWLAKDALEEMFGDLHLVMQKSHSALSQRMMILCVTFACLVFTSMCGIQHLQRAGNRHLDLFDSLWFVVVTFSTVGFGDITPDIWPSQLFMILMVGLSFVVLPIQMQQLAFTWIERQKQGVTYSSRRAQNELHVVVCATALHTDTIMDFLNEFYAHPLLQDYYVVLLSPCELDPNLKAILQVPIWTQRVIYIRGSALKDVDLSRCRMQDAEACFILAERSYADRNASDQHTILRSWAVKDFAPNCPQYVQIFRPENKLHVKFAEHVVCEDEFKHALLANNCLSPAISTLVTLLLHTSRGQEGQASQEEWQRIYGRCSGNEIYHIRLSDSRFFGEYDGKSFTYASFHAHRKFGVSLVAVQQNLPGSKILLNPGPRHIMKATDTCFYMSLTKEENSAFILAISDKGPRSTTRLIPLSGQATKVASIVAQVGTLALELQHTRSSTSINTQGNATDDPEKGNVDQSKGTGSSSLVHCENFPSIFICITSKKTKKACFSLLLLLMYSFSSFKCKLLKCQQLFHLEPLLGAGLTIQSLNRRPSIAPVPAVLEAHGINITVDSDSDTEAESQMTDETDGSDIFPGFPPVAPYIGTSPTLCHLLRDKRQLCCLQLTKECQHCKAVTANDYNWSSKVIILIADNASVGIYNFIVPLRSHFIPSSQLHPIVLLLERRPEEKFQEVISFFPLVYWMIGSMDSIDDLLKAGINMADNVVIVNKESSNSEEDDYLADCNTIVAVQTIFRLFPNANIITELSQSSNMRFMQFLAKDNYSLSLSKVEKKEKERGSHISYMFRLPFAAGNVFSASMLDTLLYQAFVKDYLITFVRLLLGIDQAAGSGHLSCMRITRDHMWIRTYGRLYQKLCSTTCEIPIGIYRSQTHQMLPISSTCTTPLISRSLKTMSASCDITSSCRPSKGTPPLASLGRLANQMMEDSASNQVAQERQEIGQMVKCRMRSLGMPPEEYDDTMEKRDHIAYVIINPSYDLKLEPDDVVYLIKPSSLSPKASPLIDERKLSLRRPRKRQEPTGADKDSIEKHVPNNVGPENMQVPTVSVSDTSSAEGSSCQESGVKGTIV
ncbi:potassium channel subfamily T member 2 [Lingula anatina]|uniref:Potassium channel subfamily T member 2 n=1 Tax=Lingula anatina TaxID=7574 RepID=A0A2R2MTW0_LINAN|nr:potassium channel subfamily T member 2 [Lingula anatina]|eukprot:XP_023933674.1 potassium channel subfamily T member 2 [Lingula anatina]